MRHKRANLHSSAHPQRETAEVRFNMLARGWLAYPRDTGGARNYRRRAVVEIPSPHRHRRGATALFRNPVRGAKWMRAGILRILQISRAGGTPLPMAGRLTQLAKIFPLIYTTAFRR